VRDWAAADAKTGGEVSVAEAKAGCGVAVVVGGVGAVVVRAGWVVVWMNGGE